MKSRNGYMLKDGCKNGYDWWWHSLVAVNNKTGELEPFFIEYYIINPGLGGKEPIFGQIPNKQQKPSYSMIKAGKWGSDKKQIHNFYGVDSFNASRDKMSVQIGDNIADDKKLIGSVKMELETVKKHPEYMCDNGDMSWDLKVEKDLSYSVGYGASKLFRTLNLFSMFWHVEGMKTKYSGTIIYNNQEYTVNPETSCGYQDKNWGRDYTNPWIWLNCNNFIDNDDKKCENTSLDIGGGNPKVLGLSLGEKILVAFNHQGTLYEFNFSHIFFQKQKWNCRIEDNKVIWDVEVSNKKHILKVNFSCPLDSMILVNYENPKGIKKHNKLYNGGYASGTVELTQKKSKKLICSLSGSMGGCEYGRYH